MIGTPPNQGTLFDNVNTAKRSEYDINLINLVMGRRLLWDSRVEDFTQGFNQGDQRIYSRADTVVWHKEDLVHPSYCA